MPDDDTATEQTEEIVEEVPDNPADEAAGFADEKDDIEDGLEGLEQPEDDDDNAAEEEDVDTEEDDTEEEEDSDEEDADAETEEEDDDEDIKRGKELQAEQDKADREQKKAEDAEKRRKADTGAYDPFTETNDAARIEFFNGVIPKNLLPDKATLKDGTELDFEAVYKNEPEIPVMITTYVNNLVNQMIANNYLATMADIKEVNTGIDNRLFKRTVMNPNYGVPNADKIYQGDDFKAWFPKQPEEIKALLKSFDPYDHIRVYKRFMNQSGLDDAKEKVTSLDKKRATKKKKFDAVHKTTARRKAAERKTVVDRDMEEQEGFDSKEDDDDY